MGHGVIDSFIFLEKKDYSDRSYQVLLLVKIVFDQIIIRKSDYPIHLLNISSSSLSETTLSFDSCNSIHAEKDRCAAVGLYLKILVFFLFRTRATVRSCRCLIR